jgi:hypothetical protein
MPPHGFRNHGYCQRRAVRLPGPGRTPATAENDLAAQRVKLISGWCANAIVIRAARNRVPIQLIVAQREPLSGSNRCVASSPKATIWLNLTGSSINALLPEWFGSTAAYLAKLSPSIILFVG